MRKYIFAILLIVPIFAIAETIKFKSPAPGLGSTPWDFIHLIIQISMWFVIPVISAVIIYSGYEIATAKGDMTQITKGKKRLYGAIIGLIVILLADYVVEAIKDTGEKILL